MLAAAQKEFYLFIIKDFLSLNCYYVIQFPTISKINLKENKNLALTLSIKEYLLWLRSRKKYN